jgi:hypothetical protein
MPQITIGPEFFVKAKNDYSDWRWSFVREFFQNCIDCGSKHITLDTKYVDGHTIITVTNDGESMTKDILVNKLLSLGSSGKSFQNTVGGFGKAKELLYFCWTSYDIRSGEWHIQGSGADYSIRRSTKSVSGTVSTIVMNGDQDHSIASQAKFFVAVANVNAKFRINGEHLRASMRTGHYRRDLNCGKVYTNRQLDNRLIVRISGIPMFTVWIKCDKCVILELTGTSADVLTSNRDGLQYEHRTELEGFLGDLVTNKRKAFSKPVIEYLRFAGDKVQCCGMAKQALLNNNAALAMNLADSLEESMEGTHRIDDGVLANCQSSDNSGTVEVDTLRVNAIAAEFVIKNETGKQLEEYWRPDSPTFSKYAYRTALIWIRLLIVMHRIFGIEDKFGVGFIFSSDVIAQHEYSQEHGRIYFLNPCVVSSARPWPQRWNAKELHQLSITALHEVVHGMGHAGHDENYAERLTSMAGELLKHTKELYHAGHFSK